MGKYTGEFDFEDEIEMSTPEKILSEYKVYTGNNIVPLKFEKPSDLIPYYPHLISFMAYSDGSGMIRLSGSYIDKHEKETLALKLEALKEYWCSCKQEKTAFNDEVAEEKVLFSRNSILHEYEMELIKRVKKLGNNATTEGIHTLYADQMRKKLYDEMVEDGWNKYWAANWCFSDRALQVVFSEVEGDDTLGPWY